MPGDSEARRVEFLVGGVQKGGTTALYEYLKRDLPVSLASVKEAHFFDDEAVFWNAPDYGAYHALFAPEDDRPRGEVTPIYLYWPNALERIAAYNPKMKLVFIFRDPVERAWSHWRMERQRNFDDAPFSWAIRDGRARVAEDRDTPGFHRIYSYVERGFYGAQFAHALRLFPPEQILSLRSDDLQQDPTASLNRLADHLALPAVTHEIAPLLANVGLEGEAGRRISADDADYLAQIYDADLQEFGALSGLRIEDWRR